MVRAEEGPSQPVQDHPEGSAERLPPGLLHRRESGPLPACSGRWEPSPFSTGCASPGWVATARPSAGRWWARAWPAWTTGSPRPPPLGRSRGPDHVQTPAPRSLPCAASGPRGLGEAAGGIGRDISWRPCRTAPQRKVGSPCVPSPGLFQAEPTLEPGAAAGLFPAGTDVRSPHSRGPSLWATC